jgi:hypothetical protein
MVPFQFSAKSPRRQVVRTRFGARWSCPRDCRSGDCGSYHPWSGLLDTVYQQWPAEEREVREIATAFQPRYVRSIEADLAAWRLGVELSERPHGTVEVRHAKEFRTGSVIEERVNEPRDLSVPRTASLTTFEGRRQRGPMSSKTTESSGTRTELGVYCGQQRLIINGVDE